MAANHTVEHIESLEKLRARLSAPEGQADRLTLADLQNHEFNAQQKDFAGHIPIDHSKNPATQIAEFHAASSNYNTVLGTMSKPVKEHLKGIEAELTAAADKVVAREGKLKGVTDYVASVKTKAEDPWKAADAAHAKAIEEETTLRADHQGKIEAARATNDEAALDRAYNESEQALSSKRAEVDRLKNAADSAKTKADADLAAKRKLPDGKASPFAKAEQEITEHEAELTKLRADRAAKVQAKHDFLSGKEVKYQVEEIVDGKAKLVTKTGKVDPHVATAYNDMHDKFGKIADPSKFKAPKVEGVVAEAAKDGEKVGMFHKAKTNGFFKTAGENMNLAAKDAEGNRRLIMKGSRIVGVGAGLYLAGKGVGQLFSGNEEDSKLMAVGKIVVGGGLAAASAVAGR